MPSIPLCPQCQSEYSYQDQMLFICPECGYEWQEGDDKSDVPETIKDAVGNALFEGDSVTLIKDLKVKGTSFVLKIGTKAKINRFAHGDHNIDCKVDGHGAMMLKSAFVKKA